MPEAEINDQMDSDSSKQPVVVLSPIRHGQRRKGVDQGPERLLTVSTDMKNTINPMAVVGPVRRPELWSPMHSPISPVIAGSDGLTELFSPEIVCPFNGKLYDLIQSSVGEIMRSEKVHPRVITLGGDHSLAMGSISANAVLAARHLKDSLDQGTGNSYSHPDLVVVWVDAHADIHTPATTPSGNLHGCPVSWLVNLDPVAWKSVAKFLQWGEEALEELVQMRRDLLKTQDCCSSFVDPKKLVYIGLRDVEDEEKEAIKKLGILAYWMTDVEELNRDMDRIVAEALATVDPHSMHPIHCSFDIDGLDPQWAPATGTPVDGGLSLTEGCRVVELLSETGRLVSMDLVEVNPSLSDLDGVQRTLESADAILKSFS